MTKKILFICLILLSSTYTLAAGEISMLRGEASVIRAASKLEAKVQMPIKAKDAIETKANSKAQLTFKDKTVVTIGANTMFSVEDYLFEDKKSSAKFNVKGGSFKVITGKIGKLAPKSFLLKTKTSLIGIRGTVFAGNVEEEAGDYIGCLQGAITVSSIKTGERKKVGKGQMVRVDQNGKLGKVQKLNSENIDNLSGDTETRNEQDDNNKQVTVEAEDLKEVDDDIKPDINTLISEKTKVSYEGDLKGKSEATTESSSKIYKTKAKIKADMKADIDFGGNEPLKVTISKQKLSLEEASVNGRALTGDALNNAKQALSADNELTSTMNMKQTLNPDALTIKGTHQKTANGLTSKANLDGKFSDELDELDGTLKETTKGEVNGVKIDRSINSTFDLEQKK